MEYHPVTPSADCYHFQSSLEFYPSCLAPDVSVFFPLATFFSHLLALPTRTIIDHFVDFSSSYLRPLHLNFRNTESMIPIRPQSSNCTFGVVTIYSVIYYNIYCGLCDYNVPGPVYTYIHLRAEVHPLASKPLLIASQLSFASPNSILVPGI